MMIKNRSPFLFWHIVKNASPFEPTLHRVWTFFQVRFKARRANMSTGLLPAPPGVTPNFSTSALSSTQVAYIIAYTITLGLASSTLGIRLYTRISIMNSFGLDDCRFFAYAGRRGCWSGIVAIILSYACSIAYFAITIDCGWWANSFKIEQRRWLMARYEIWIWSTSMGSYWRTDGALSHS